MGDLKITLTRSLIGQKPSIRKTAIALGLKRPNKSIIRKDTPYIRGMIRKVSFMVKVEEL
ncbi:50S ribosomal protein L30 [Hippea maritima]|uniref:50S ribosomal protein L30 n=1 Tax=Hippea maritima (strain ATCC 700847 / DSM 10411 / MH2) TaxID=760142 RepID=F2LXS4_HIPMA|nr:50S ribosomal protein L30 [Hippea maritima]AEA34315.1 ribosomal protein L30 [Hippea maritima DSM 10411]